MKCRVEILPEAELELEEALRWYEDQRGVHLRPFHGISMASTWDVVPSNSTLVSSAVLRPLTFPRSPRRRGCVVE